MQALFLFNLFLCLQLAQISILCKLIINWGACMNDEITGKSKGGVARAAKLTPEERKNIATKAAKKRWSTVNNNKQKLPKAIYQGELTIGDRVLSCAVLEDGTRIISRNAIFRAFGRTKRGRAKEETRVLNMPSFIDAKNLQPFIDDTLKGELIPIEYNPVSGISVQTGYNALILPKICDVYLSARLDGILTKSQLPLAAVSEILVRSLSKIGIIALIDEATGYQEKRDRDELSKLLAVYLSEEKLRWAKMFPDEFYKQIYRLRNWSYPTGAKRTPLVGKITNQIVYEKLPPGVLDELKKRNPVIKEIKRRKWKYTQFLSEDIGQPDLRDHLLQLIALMRASSNWHIFKKLFIRAFPSPGDQLSLDIDDE